MLMDNNLSKVENKDKALRWKNYYLLAILTLLIILALFWLEGNPDIAEAYARHVFPVLAFIPRYLINFIPFSIFQFAVPLAALAIIAVLLNFIYKFAKGPNRASIFKRFIKLIIIIICIMVPLFYLNFGYTYHRHRLSNNLELEIQKRSKEDLNEVSLWLLDEVNKYSPSVLRHDDHVMYSSLSNSEIFKMADDAYEVRAKTSEDPFVKQHLYLGPVRVKGMQKNLSHLWSYTGITGIYVPFLVESTVNTDVSTSEMIATALHEVAHSYGFAREEEANFMAFFTGIVHPHADFQYAAYLHAFVHTANKLYAQDKTMHSDLMQKLDPAVRQELSARSAYWAQFEGPVQEVSTQINNSYLKSNKQEQGVKSYGEVVDLIVAYYFSEIKGQ